MAAILLLILSQFRLATVTRQLKPATSLRCVFDRLTGQQVVAADWHDLRHLQAWLARNRGGGVYLIVGWQNGRRRVRVGEGVKLWVRLGDHKADPQITAFAQEVYVLRSKHFSKADTVYLQEAFSEIVQAEARLDWYKGCKPLRDFPLSEDDRKLLDVVVLLGLGLLADAGLRVLQPAQSRLARQVASLLTQASA
ncbi:hypothetical protein [Methylobacterium sp. D48H]